METKKETRKRILQMRDALSEQVRRDCNLRISDFVFSMEEYKRAQVILAFVSYQSEVDTLSIIQNSLKRKKRVFAPKVIKDEMRFFEIQSMDDLSIGYKGILEPNTGEHSSLEHYLCGFPEYDMAKPTAFWMEEKPEKGKALKAETTTILMLMPGAVFDEEGNRIGYGKGFYDRFLEKGFRGKKIALAYDFQIVPRKTFETEITDIKPDCIVTEKGVKKWN